MRELEAEAREGDKREAGERDPRADPAVQAKRRITGVHRPSDERDEQTVGALMMPASCLIVGASRSTAKGNSIWKAFSIWMNSRAASRESPPSSKKFWSTLIGIPKAAFQSSTKRECT